MLNELNGLTIAEVSQLIKQRKVSPVEVTKAALDLIEAIDGQLFSFVTVTAERARAEARVAESEIYKNGPRSPMHGVPFGLKDIFETSGVLTKGQSRLLANYVPTRDCDAQERLSAAGGVLLGKNTTWEFAHGAPSPDDCAPPARNPWNLEHHPSGSSSGSAAAVAAGITPASMGTDTGGSVRLPAAVCGIAGLKPTYGRISRRGVLPNCFSHDHVGPLAWTVEDIAILMNIVAGHDPEDPASVDMPVPDYRAALNRGVRGLTIGVPTRWLEEDLKATAVTLSAFDASLTLFKDMGAVIKEIKLPPIVDFEDSKRIIAMAELFSIHQENLRHKPDLFGASLRYRIIAGSLIRAEEYIKAMRMRAVLTRDVQKVFTDVDLIMLPTAEPAGKMEQAPRSSFFQRRTYTCPFNVSGNPALSICNGFTEEGLPTSLQVVGRLFGEATVLRAGHAYEVATTWRKRRPPVSFGRAEANKVRAGV